jgi:hypothetical protein
MKHARIKKGKIKFVSYVLRGANKMPALYKSDGTFEINPITKYDDERGELLCVVYAPEFRDTQGHIASTEVVKELCYSYSQDGEGIDIRHDGKPLTQEQAYVAENFIVQKDDPRFVGWVDDRGNALDATGSWAQVHKIEDEEIRKQFRDGALSAVSLAGEAILEAEDMVIEATAENILALFKAKLGATSAGDIDMDKTELQELLKASEDRMSALVEGLAKQSGDAPAPDDSLPAPDSEEPVFKGDYACREDVQKHADAWKAYRLAKSVDWNDPKSLDNYLSTMSKEDDADQGREGDGGGSSELNALLEKQAKLEEQVKSLRKRSNQPAPADEEHPWLSKEEAAQEKLGLDMADYLNKGR